MLNQVCGQDNQVYASPCELKRAACESGQENVINYLIQIIKNKLPKIPHLRLSNQPQTG